jgi:hypothetical protein
VLHNRYSISICSRLSFLCTLHCFVVLCYGFFVAVNFQYHLHQVNSLLTFLLCLLCKFNCVDYTLNNLFAYFDYLHSCKMLIFLIIFFANQ